MTILNEHRLPRYVREVIAEYPMLPWSVELGAKHNKLFLEKRIATVCTRGERDASNSRDSMNTRATLRRAIKAYYERA